MLRGVVDELLFGVRPDPLGAASAAAGLGDGPRWWRCGRSVRRWTCHTRHSGRRGVVGGLGDRARAVAEVRPGRGRPLVVGLRPGELPLPAGDDQVLRLTVPVLAQTLRARALAAEVHESRGRTIAAVEEERRRLRRDLHDGLGPRLSGVAFTGTPPAT